jgi:hypothetical protein
MTVGASGRAEYIRRRSPVSIPAASPKAALHAFTAKGGGSFAAPTGHALSAAANRYRGQAVTLTVQKQNKAGKFETVAIFTTK